MSEIYNESYKIIQVKTSASWCLAHLLITGDFFKFIFHEKKFCVLLLCFPSEASPSPPIKSSPETSPMTSPRQRRDSDRYCQLCNAWFNNPGMAQQHYDGKKHKKNAARADLLEQLGKTLDMGEMKGTEHCWVLGFLNHYIFNASPISTFYNVEKIVFNGLSI